jgi:hypothetical protein
VLYSLHIESNCCQSNPKDNESLVINSKEGWLHI